MWGDASNWWLTTVGDNVFEYESSFSSVRMEFTLDGAGRAAEMVHDLDFMANPLRVSAAFRTSGTSACLCPGVESRSETLSLSADVDEARAPYLEDRR